jgi:hypothetical protein
VETWPPDRRAFLYITALESEIQGFRGDDDNYDGGGDVLLGFGTV